MENLKMNQKERLVIVGLDENALVTGYFPNWIEYKELPKNFITIKEEDYTKLDFNIRYCVEKGRLVMAPLEPKTYIESRAALYPSVIEQLDIIYHEGLEGWKKQITNIKNKYPKE